MPRSGFLFNPALFWDVDIGRLYIDSHAGFIIERVVTRGDMSDWEALLSCYGRERIRDEVVTIRALDPRSLNYLRVCFNIAADDFRCCN